MGKSHNLKLPREMEVKGKISHGTNVLLTAVNHKNSMIEFVITSVEVEITLYIKTGLKQERSSYFLTGV